MKKKLTLALDMLEKELEVLSLEQQADYYGGELGSNGEWIGGPTPVTDYLSSLFGAQCTSSIDSQGNWVFQVAGSSNFIKLSYGLGEVTIHADRPSSNSLSGWGALLSNPYYYQMGTDQYGGAVPYFNPDGNGGGGTSTPTHLDIVNNGISRAYNYLGREYMQEGGDLRSANTPEALQYMDCSELVSRYLNDVGISGVLGDNTGALKDFAANNPWLLTAVTTPQVGDIFIWRVGDNGHTGIVTGVDASTGMVTTLEAISESPNSNHPGETWHSVLEHTYDPNASHFTGDSHNWGSDGNGWYRPNP